MSALASGLYEGSVYHRRMRPKSHVLRQRLFQVLLDLDELDTLDRRLRFFGRNRRALVAFHDGDHGDGSGDLRGWAQARLAEAGISPQDGPIRLLCIPRVFGFAFNPLSVWFCHADDGRLTALIYQVNNTFGERHAYVIPVVPASADLVLQRCAKSFFVSPFMDMSMSYDFAVRPPAEDVTVRVDGSDADGPLIATSFTGRRREFDDWTLLDSVLRWPVNTIAVVAGIGWGAFRIWLKGVRYRRRTPAPALGVTIVSPDSPMDRSACPISARQ